MVDFRIGEQSLPGRNWILNQFIKPLYSLLLPVLSLANFGFMLHQGILYCVDDDKLFHIVGLIAPEKIEIPFDHP